MCSDCGTNEPLTLLAKNATVALAFATILNDDRGGVLMKYQEDGTLRAIPITVEGNVLTIPWGGDAEFMTSLAQAAVSIGVAEMDEAQEMCFRGTADSIGVPVEVLRSMRDQMRLAAGLEPVRRSEPAPEAGAELLSGIDALLRGDSIPEFRPGYLG